MLVVVFVEGENEKKEEELKIMAVNTGMIAYNYKHKRRIFAFEWNINKKNV